MQFDLSLVLRCTVLLVTAVVVNNSICGHGTVNITHKVTWYNLRPSRTMVDE